LPGGQGLSCIGNNGTAISAVAIKHTKSAANNATTKPVEFFGCTAVTIAKTKSKSVKANKNNALKA